jgi:hypothetical protein
LNRTAQLGGKRRLHRIDFKQRFYNRELSTEKVLNMLYHEAPRLWELAEVVGKWVWIQFDEKQPPVITAELSELGFHWNNRRQSWQHPCGRFGTGIRRDPREIYGSYFPADLRAT